jgi:uncharacterized protein (TIGR02284 family)
MMVHMNDLDLLSDLVRTNLNAEAAFTVCAHKTQNERLGAMLLARALLCGQAARRLTELLHARGGELREQRPGESIAVPNWMALDAALIEHDDNALRDECARTEDETLLCFRDVLEHDLPTDIRRALENHFAAMLQYCGRLRKVRLHPARRAHRPAEVRDTAR